VGEGDQGRVAGGGRGGGNGGGRLRKMRRGRGGAEKADDLLDF
jgi:hypothetical protein